MTDILHHLVPLIEIAIIAVMVYYTLSFFWNSRGVDLMIGIASLLALYVGAVWLNLPVVQKLSFYLIYIAILALLIVFQPELRASLSRLSVRSKKYGEITEFDRFLDGIVHAVYRLSERRIGGLIAIENHDSLEEYANKSVMINAKFSPELLETIFATTTPLHDGAVIIRGTSILSASAILPLADDTTQLSRSMGTRHRAGLGISQITDALIIVISEENGKVSIARDGIMTRGIKIDRFKGILRSIFAIPKAKLQSRFDIIGWLKQWIP